MVDALVFVSLLTLGTSPPPVPAAPTVEPQELLSETPSSGVSLLDYQLSQTQRAEVADGRTKVSVETNAAAPAAGSMAVRFFIDNSVGPAQAVRLEVQGSVGGGRHRASRVVEVKAGERRAVTVPVPADFYYGEASASGPGINKQLSANVYFQRVYDPQRAVLALAPGDDVVKFIGKQPSYSEANVQIVAVPASEAPTELAGYLGYDLVLVPNEESLAHLDGPARQALESYLLGGGAVLVKGPLRDTSVFPQAKSAERQAYGFGTLFIAEKPDASSYFRAGLPVNPQGALRDYERRYSYGNASGVKPSLLPQATAPLGRFLFIIALFTLAIGPGSLFISRRRGPAALLVTIPATAFATCALIIGYSLMADGFTVHAASYGITLLQPREHRAVTAGVTAYYANLAPSKVRFSVGSVPVSPWDGREAGIADWSWSDGLSLGADFVPSRTYREWGFVSVEPTRARLLLKKSGDAWALQNALGFDVEKVVVNVDGALFESGAVRDGGEVRLERTGGAPPLPDANSRSRFSERVVQQATRPLEHGEFLARARGMGFVPTGGITTQLHDSEQLIRGEVEQ